MAGDEIVADWLGNVYGNNVTTTATAQRFDSNSRRFRTVKIHNGDNADEAYIGKYYSNTTTFINNAMRLQPVETQNFMFIDLHELGYCTFITAVSINILGINEY